MHHVLVSGVKLEKINGNETPINVQLFESKLMIINPSPDITGINESLTLIMSEKRDLTIKIQSMDGVHVKSIALLLESSWLLLACKTPLSPRSRRIL